MESLEDGLLHDFVEDNLTETEEDGPHHDFVEDNLTETEEDGPHHDFVEDNLSETEEDGSHHDVSTCMKVEIVIPKNKMKELEEFLAEQGGKITADLPVQVQDASSQVDEQSNSSPLTVPNPDVFDTAKISQEVLRMLQGNKIPIAQFGFHVLERSQGRTSEILNKPKAFEKLSEEGKEVYRKMKEWLQQKDGIDDIRGKMQGKRKRPLPSSTCNSSGRTKFSDLQRIALERLFKESKYPTQGVLEEFSNRYKLDAKTVKVWFNNKRQRHNTEEQTSSESAGESVNVVFVSK